MNIGAAFEDNHYRGYVRGRGCTGTFSGAEEK